MHKFHLLNIFNLGLKDGFDGTCRYGENEAVYIGDVTLNSVDECKKNCQNTYDCKAYSYSSTEKDCLLWSSGPYTYGNGVAGYKCYNLENVSYGISSYS